MDALKARFRPEFLNRIDEFVTFESLGKGQLEGIKTVTGAPIVLAGIDLPDAHPAVQLKHVQELHEAGDARVPPIFNDIGICLGYALGLYAEFYDFSQLLALGRVTSGRGGEQIVSRAEKVLRGEFPELAEKVQLQLPDEKSKRVGQAVAAASLPKLGA